MNKVLKVQCPNCNEEFSYYDSNERPFCSERCRMVDLGHWFKESYRVPDKNKLPDDQTENNEDENNTNEKQNINEEDDEFDNENNY